MRIHRAQDRGTSLTEWLESYHSFSFADYFDATRMNFGKLRVFNDDYVKGGNGFGMHPHRDMEIVTIVLQGAIRHEDSLGNKTVLKQGQVQSMTAGTGVFHSEVNDSQTEDLHFLQIWIEPNHLGLTPAYEEKTIEEKENEWIELVGKEGLTINQDTTFSLANLNKELSFKPNQANTGLFCFIIEGEIELENNIFKKGDSLEIESKELQVKPNVKSKLLIIEVPLI